MKLREHTFLGTTQSLCPECLALVPAKIITRQGRVYFRKHCPVHGTREDFVCSDVRQYDRMEFSLPGKVPAEFGTTPEGAAVRTIAASAPSTNNIPASAWSRLPPRATCTARCATRAAARAASI